MTMNSFQAGNTRRTGGICLLAMLAGVFLFWIFPPTATGANESVPETQKVRLSFPSRAALQELLGQIVLEDFSREAVRPRPGSDAITVELRISPAEAAALSALGQSWTALGSSESSRSDVTLPDDFISYRNNAEIGDLLAAWEVAYPDLARRVQWGTSVEQRPLWGLVISDDVQHTEAEPEVRLAATMHGNEPVGTVMLLNIAELLLTSYGQDGQQDLTDLVAAREIHIMPMLNPDGYFYGLRTNALAVDLNRDFPEPSGYHQEQAPETLAFMDYGLGHHFAISLNMHAGALVVNYPWDYTYERAPDDAAIIALSYEYADRNPPMAASEYFPGGITHGATWYAANGTLQDWSYAVTGCIDLTIELSDTKRPAESLLPDLWEDNRESLLQFIRAADFGLYGTITDEITGEPLAATVTVAGNALPVETDPEHGDYTKLLPTGTWAVTVNAEGYDQVMYPDVETIWGEGTRLDVHLLPEGWRPPRPPDDIAISVWDTPGPGPFPVLYEGGASSWARLKVFDLRGSLIADLGPLPVRGRTQWDGHSTLGGIVPSGNYFLRLESEAGTATERVMLVR